MLLSACFRDSYTKGIHSGGEAEEQNLFSNHFQCFQTVWGCLVFFVWFVVLVFGGFFGVCVLGFFLGLFVCFK